MTLELDGRYLVNVQDVHSKARAEPKSKRAPMIEFIAEHEHITLTQYISVKMTDGMATLYKIFVLG